MRGGGEGKTFGDLIWSIRDEYGAGIPALYRYVYTLERIAPKGVQYERRQDGCNVIYIPIHVMQPSGCIASIYNVNVRKVFYPGSADPYGSRIPESTNPTSGTYLSMRHGRCMELKLI